MDVADRIAVVEQAIQRVNEALTEVRVAKLLAPRALLEAAARELQQALITARQ